VSLARALSPALVALAACGAEPSASHAPPRDASHAPPTKVESPRLGDPRWIRALRGDPLEHARLADALPTPELVEGVLDGGALAAAALAAIPHADDADLALGPLAALAQRAADAPRALARTGEPAAPLDALLRALLAIAGRPPTAREPLDPDGVREAARALCALAVRADLSDEARALARSAERALPLHAAPWPSRAAPTSLAP
jgi:hypothetical protein